MLRRSNRPWTRRTTFSVPAMGLMGLAAAYMARDWIQRQAIAVPAPTNTIVVAAAPVGFGTELTRDNTAEILWAAANLPDGAFAGQL